MFTRDDVKKLSKKYGVDNRTIKLDALCKGMGVELEHGTKLGDKTNVSHDDKDITFRIALAHLEEYPDYYQRLEAMEVEADKYWKEKKERKKTTSTDGDAIAPKVEKIKKVRLKIINNSIEK